MNADPMRDPLAVQVRRRRPFYEQYLLPRIEQFCEAKGACEKCWTWTWTPFGAFIELDLTRNNQSHD